MMTGIVFPPTITSFYPKAIYYIIISDIKKRAIMYCSADGDGQALEYTAVSRKVVG